MSDANKAGWWAIINITSIWSICGLTIRYSRIWEPLMILMFLLVFNWIVVKLNVPQQTGEGDV